MRSRSCARSFDSNSSRSSMRISPKTKCSEHIETEAYNTLQAILLRDSSVEEGEQRCHKLPLPHYSDHHQPSFSFDMLEHKERSNMRQPSWQKTVLVVSTCVLFLVAALEFGLGLSLIVRRTNGAASWFPTGWRRSYPRFLVIGDWGRDGTWNQSVVADMMAKKAATFNPDFIISTGDNFYESGLTSPDDPQFDTSFRDIYSHPELANVPWKVALGNHDHGETDDPEERPSSCSHTAWKNGECFYSPLHQLDVRLTERDARWHCERFFTLSLADGDVEIFFIDTTPIITSYYDRVWADNRGGLKEQSWEDQLMEFEGRLVRSKASWKLVVGHHPVRTNHRPDGMFKDMVDAVEPLLTSNNVRAYFCGHDHNLQYIFNSDRQYHQITSGAGSAIGGYFYDDKDSPFQWGGNGFVAVEMEKNAMKVEYIGVDSLEPLYTTRIPRNP